MSQPVIQTAFHSGEWAPSLYARVDVGKYHSACALALNYYVDYRGGLSSRMGTQYILQAFKSSTAVRLIPFQASTTVGYVLEFGDQYVRFYIDGSVVLEGAKTITGITNANPGVVTTSAPHAFSSGEWGLLTVSGMTLLNNRYVRFSNVGASTFELTDLNGNNINTTAMGAFVSGNVRRVYTLSSPYAAEDLALLKFAQNIDRMEFCHPDYVPYELKLISATNWTLLPLTFGTTVSTPGSMTIATSAAGAINYSYCVTAVDITGQESSASAIVSSTVTNAAGAQTITVGWGAVSGAQSYNIYRAQASSAGVVPTGSQFGFVSNVTGVSFADLFNAGQPINPADFTEGLPIPRNPFQGGSLASVTVTTAGAYTTVPTVTIGVAPAGGVTATASAVLSVQGTPTVAVSQDDYVVGDLVFFANGVILVVAAVNGSGEITAFRPTTWPQANGGAIASGSTPSNPVTSTGTSGIGTGVTANLTWGVGAVTLTNAGAGYVSAPAVTFSAGAAAATAVVGSTSSGNPSVPIFSNQRLFLMGPPGSPHQFNGSQPGRFYNFNVTNPALPDDAIEGTLVSSVLNEIKSALPMSSGLIILADRAAWQLYGSQPGSPATAIDVTAQAQAYVGANDVPPIVANDNILYIQANGASVRNLNYNFYANVYTGTDISILSSHLLYNKEITEWCWAEEPFKIAWLIRSDGVMLSLTFVKEQELIGWTHHNTDGLWKSCASVVEQLDTMRVNAVYLVAERTINGNTVKYIERMADRTFTNFTNPWCVDAGLVFVGGAPATSFSGCDHLIGESVVGLADGIPFTATISATGTFTLATAATRVYVGLQFVPDFTSLSLDTGNPTIQGKMKKITGPTLRVQETLGLQIGQSFSTLVPIDDLVVGNVGTMTNETVADLVTGDVRQSIDPDWTEQGQFSIRQPLPYPATILGIMPELTVGDTEK